MLKHLRSIGLLVLTAALLLGTAGTVMAGDDTYIQGLVFIDSNLNGVWDKGEEGYPGEWVEYWEDDELIQRYVGTTVELSAGDEANPIILETAGSRLLNEGEVDLCTYQDYTTADGDDDDTLVDINLSPARPCTGSWGLRPAGDNGTIWTVAVTAPEGYVLTTPGPVYVVTDSNGLAPVDVGIAPVGSGGATEATTVTVSTETEAGSAALLPVTGGSLLPGLIAAVTAFGGIGLLVAKTKIRN